MDYQLVTRAEDLGPVAAAVTSADVVGLDTEATSLRPLDGKLRLVQLSAGDRVWVIDLFQTQTLGPVRDALSSSKAIKIIQNAKFEQKYLLHEFGVEIWPLFDTFRASSLIYNGKKGFGHNLYDIYKRELGLSPPTADLGGSNWSGSLTKGQYEYAASDVVYLPMLREKLRAKLQQFGLMRVALIEFGAVLPEAVIELNGFPLNRQKWLDLAKSNAAKTRELAEQLYAELPNPGGQTDLFGAPGFNLNSPPQILASLHAMDIMVEDTEEMTIAPLAGDHPILKTFLEYRKYSKSLSSFGPKFLKHVHPKTGCIHADFFPFTGAGRYACSKPNLQQIPREKEFRACFCPEDGFIFLICDYSGIEMRIVAELSQDPRLLRVFREGKDPHRSTAALVADVPEDQVTKQQRQQAKPVNFGLIYGMKPPKLRTYAAVNYGVYLSEREAQRFYDRYFEGYYGVQNWHEEILRNKRSGVCRTMSGRLRYMDDDAYNEFFNTPVQGTGADGMKTALRIVCQNLKKAGDHAKMIHMVHDEIVLKCPKDPVVVEESKKVLREGMIQGMRQFLKTVPVEAEVSEGASWADK